MKQASSKIYTALKHAINIVYEYTPMSKFRSMYGVMNTKFRIMGTSEEEESRDRIKG